MLLASISVGIICGLFITWVKLNLGMPGHKGFFWMAPVLIARLRTGCKTGTTAGGLSAALTTYCLGANLAGGLIGLPLIVLAAAVLDVAVNYIEKNKSSFLITLSVLCLAGIAANIICLAKRMILPTGINASYIFGVSGFWFKILSYGFFGFLSGFTAAISTRIKKQNDPNAS